MWYLVLSRTVRTEEEMKLHSQSHLDWLFEQHRLGRALFSGRTKEHDYGIYVLLAENLEAARALAAEDPYHVYGDREMQVFEWNPQRAMRMDISIAAIEAMARYGAPRSG